MSAPLPTISIALATYNGSRYIRDQLDSLLTQTVKPIEIIVCDDNSTDDTLDIVRNIATETTIPVSVSINETRLGYRANFMRAASLTSGQLVSYCDQDDVWHPDKLQVVAELFKDPEMFLVCHNAAVVDENGKSIGQYVHKSEMPSRVFGRLEMIPWNSPLGFTQVFRRELLQLSALRLSTEDHFVSSEHFAHDQWMPLLAGAFGKIAYTNKVLVDYRQHQNNLFGLNLSTKTKMAALAHRILKHSDYERLSRVSLKISNMFAAAQSELSTDLATKAEDARQRYAQLADAYSKRSLIYTGRHLAKRASGWIEMVKRGTYTSQQPISFAQKAFARDFVAGVLLGGLGETAASTQFRTDYDGSLQFKPVR